MFLKEIPCSKNSNTWDLPRWILNLRRWIRLFILKNDNTTISSIYRIKQLLPFDSVNVWINWLLKKIHTFISSKYSKCIIFLTIKSIKVPSDKVANLCFGHRRYVCIYRPHFVFWLTDAANELLFHLLIKIECS
jgi:hypothetical protein